MLLKPILILTAIICCNGQQLRQQQGNVRQFLSYPTVRRGGPADADALAIAAPLLRGPVAPIVLPPQAQLERVATLGLTNGVTGGIALGAKAQFLGPVIAAILTHRTAEVIDVPVPPDVIQPQILIIEPNLLPVTIEFRSQSSPVNINQVHIPGPPGEVKETRSEEEPDRVLHEVVKPVIQEVREIIQPFRKITQEILPVQEEVHSVVARGQNHKVLQEIAIPPPVPIAVHSEGPVGAVVARRVEGPVVTALGQQFGPGGTVVRAGLIGGARIIEAPNAVPRLPAKREANQPERPSLNNRPSRPVKRDTARHH